MGWLFGWLAFGLLTAYKAGELASHSAGESALLMALGALVASAVFLAAGVRGAVRSARPQQMLALLLICLAGLAACFFVLYGGDTPVGGWATVALAGGAYLLLSLGVGAAGLLIAWRRLRAQEEEATLAMIDRERRIRMERILAESARPADARQDDADLQDEDEYRLPTRPKWDESI